jgi:hypothetical protein
VVVHAYRFYALTLKLSLVNHSAGKQLVRNFGEEDVQRVLARRVEEQSLLKHLVLGFDANLGDTKRTYRFYRNGEIGLFMGYCGRNGTGRT